MTMRGLNELILDAGIQGNGPMDGNPHELLLWRFQQVERQFGVHLHLHDVSGRISTDAGYEGTLSRYRYHANPFCNQVKQQAAGFALCVRQKERLVARCRQTRSPFFGMCPMGVGELVVPIWWQNQLLGVLCAGFLSPDPEAAVRRLRRGCADTGLAFDSMEILYGEMTGSATGEAHALKMELASLALQLALLFGKHGRNTARVPSVPKDQSCDVQDQDSAWSGSLLVRQAQHFIRTYYAQDLTLPLIASWCFCHPNHLSTAFRKRTGVTVSAFIRTVRVEMAAEQLDITREPVSAIASSVGIPDADYFSVVFKSQMGLSPSAYRNRKT
mgnify:CR=1 FL=1